MRLVFLIASLAISGIIANGGEGAKRKVVAFLKEQQEVMNRVNAHHEALRNKDASTLNALLAEEYTSIQTEGILLNKAEELS